MNSLSALRAAADLHVERIHPARRRASKADVFLGLASATVIDRSGAVATPVSGNMSAVGVFRREEVSHDQSRNYFCQRIANHATG